MLEHNNQVIIMNVGLEQLQRMENLEKYPEEFYEDYNEMLNDVYGDVSVAGYTYDTSQALWELDPIAYNVGFNDWVSSELYRLREDIEAYNWDIRLLDSHGTYHGSFLDGNLSDIPAVYPEGVYEELESAIQLSLDDYQSEGHVTIQGIPFSWQLE